MSVGVMRKRSVVVPPAEPEGVQVIFHDHFEGGQLNPANGVVYSNDRGGLEYSEIVAAGDPGAVVEVGYEHSLQSVATASALGVLGSRPQINMGFPACREIAGIWRIHVPANIWHRNNYTPPSTPEADNNKFWIVWGGAYSSGTAQAGCETITNGVGSAPSDGISRTLPKMRSTADGVYTEIPGMDQTALIGAGCPMVPDSWNTVEFYVKKASAIGVNDGAFFMRVNGEIIHDATDLPIGASDPEKFAQDFDSLYLLGEQNSGYDEDTKFHTQYITLANGDPRLLA